MSDMIDIIDNQNNVINTKRRADLEKGELIRFIHIYLFDKNGDMIIQQRQESRIRPNLIDCSVGGHVDAGETFEEAAYREMQEELGIQTEIEFVCDSWGEYGLCKLYKGYYDGELKPNPEEVKHVQKISFHEMKKLHRTYPFMLSNGFVDSYSRYLETIYPNFDVVNENDEVIGECDFHEMKQRGLSVRVIHLLVRNAKGELLFQQRSEFVDVPLRFDDAATGHVDVGETYEQAAEREAREELGVELDLTGVEPFYYGKLPHNNKFCKAYVIDHEGPFNAEAEEVANLVWLSEDEIEWMQAKMPYMFTNSALVTYKKYKDFINQENK